MNLNWNVDVGNLLTAAGMLIVFYTAHTQSIKRMERIETKLSLIYSWFVRSIVNGNHDESED